MNAMAKMFARSLTVLMLTASTYASASGFPDRNLNMVVLFGAGGTSDTVSRLVGQSLEGVLKQTVVVENRPGAGGNIGMSYVARSAPDGYTLLSGTPGITTNHALYRNLNYDPQNDFRPISLVARAPNVIVVGEDNTATSLSELIEQGKTDEDGLNYGSAGAGTSSHLAGELLQEITGMNLMHIPYKGGAAALTDLASGRLDLMIIPLPEAIGLIRGGQIRALALASNERSTLAPDVPTTQEAGLSDFEAGSWYGLLAPRDTPDDAIKVLSEATAEALKSSTVQEVFQTQGIQMVASSPEEFQEFLQSETERWGAIIEKNQIRLD